MRKLTELEWVIDISNFEENFEIAYNRDSNYQKYDKIKHKDWLMLNLNTAASYDMHLPKADVVVNVRVFDNWVALGVLEGAFVSQSAPERYFNIQNLSIDDLFKLNTAAKIIYETCARNQEEDES